MSGTFSITVSEARGFTALPANLDALAVVIGFSSLGTGLSPFFISGSQAVAQVGYGDGADTLCQIVEQRLSSGNGKKVPCALYTPTCSTVGTYGTPDVTGVTGTAVCGVDSTVHPYGTNEARFKTIAGGTIGTAGITFQWSLDGGRNYSNTTALGTATTYTIPNSNVKFTFGVVVTGTTDATSGALYGGGGTLNGLTLILNVNGGGSTTLNLVGAGNAANQAAFLAAIHSQWPTIAATVNGSNHLVLTDANGASIVVGAGTANTALGLTANTYSGTLIAGDTIKVRTFAPAPSTTDVDAAFTALAAASADFALVVCDFDCTAAMAAHITTGLNALKAVGKRCAALVRSRLPTFESNETETVWASSVEADYASFTDSRICVRAAYGLLTDAMTTRQYLRSTLAQFAADVVRIPRAEWPCAPADRDTGLGGEPNVSLSDANGATVGHDEGSRGAVSGLSNDTLGNRFSCEQRLDVPAIREAVFNTVPWVMYSADEQIRNLPTRRLANAIERTAVFAGVPKLGGKVFYTRTSPTTGTLTAASRKAVQGSIYQAIKGEFGTEIDNANDAALDTGLVQISSGVTLSGGNLVAISGTVNPSIGGFVLSIAFTLNITE